MIPAGYMAKFVADHPDWLGVPGVDDIYSVSGCVSPYFASYHDALKHNGFWLFDSIELVRQVASQKAINLKGCKFLYYELFEREFDDEGDEQAIELTDLPFATNVSVPAHKLLEGYDVVTFYGGADPE
jgi:hypothetical protein